MAETDLAAARVDPERRVADLLGVLEAARRFAKMTDLATLRELVEQTARRLLDCEEATLSLYDPRSVELVGRALRGGVEAGLPGVPWPQGEAFDARGRVDSPEPSNVLACPVVSCDGAPIGILRAAAPRRERFDAWDLVLIRALATQTESAILRLQFAQEKSAPRFEHDLDLKVTSQIPSVLMPRWPPILEGYDIAGWYQPADVAGGDFFDFEDRGAGRLAVAIGDVSGHGFGPALVVASCRAFLHATLVQTDEPSRVLSAVNQLLCLDHLEDRFVTAFFGLLRSEAHRLDYVSAGQGPILFFSRADGAFEELEIQGFPLGLSPDLTFGPSRAIAFAPGDFLALITDGFFEWYNTHGECFGVERMKAQLDRDRDRTAAEMIQRLYAAVFDFASGSPQPDDLTAVVIKRLE